ncbi:TIGR00299 family protein [Methanobrevibacter sp. 87.7]|uniref:nickel pincer cofactor biosynthesis protein LarC n=1 Tax=Methanobrevibacter sp. 87.7 TaxID=387957 RepID=UPI000B50E13B|nr:nickel pincer cofactor biosynthesis protein LarC [Methanobrevibacter sp. 87.7]OWT33207.1 TIGR00299 family protein [Methanobrevibacter sp. 87.7]
MTIIIDPQSSGISGNMLIGALVDLGANKEDIKRITEKVTENFGGVNTEITKVNKSGIEASFCNIKTLNKNNKNHGIHYKDLIRNIDKLDNIISKEIIEKSKEVFEIIAKAESTVHGKSLDEIHFHEVGAADAVADVIGTIYGFYQLGLNKETVIGLPISVGGGRVKTAHGIVSIPAPATVEILKGLNFQGGPVASELATPTGCALYKVLCDKYLEFIPNIKIEKIAYGAGSKNFEHPNILRILKGENSSEKGEVNVLETNVDHLSGEELGYLYDKLLDAGARDVIMIPIFMKKNRPGQLIQVMGHEDNIENLLNVLFEETGTLGIRISPKLHRGIASREFIKLPLKINKKKYEINFKIGYYNGKIISKRAEFEDTKKIAIDTGLSLTEIRELANIEIRKYLKNNKN